MNCLITGGAGFIGSNLAEYLLKKGWRVRILDNLSTGKLENLDSMIEQLEFIEGDIRDESLVEKAIRDCPIIFHQAALPSVPRSIADPAASHDVNVNGTFKLLLAAQRAKARRVILASSSSVYGDSEVLPRREELTPSPLSPYAVTKLAGEYYARAFSQVYGLETVSLRYFNVFGPRQDPDSPYAAVVPRFIQALLNDQRPVIYGDGLQSRDFTYVDHVSEINYLAATSNGNFCGEVFNVGCGRRFTLLELLEILKVIAGRPAVEPVFEPPQPGDVRHSQASIDKARKLLGYQPQTDFPEELKKTSRWFSSLKN
ncbi:MAG TPA: SDR family oxidoreductase [archaeon]|nr:SDR family oxidoreductase [archaeon]